MFYNCGDFNQDISGWNVKSVTNMNHMFISAEAFNQDINNWDVSNVKDINTMLINTAIAHSFYDLAFATKFNLPHPSPGHEQEMKIRSKVALASATNIIKYPNSSLLTIPKDIIRDIGSFVNY